MAPYKSYWIIEIGVPQHYLVVVLFVFQNILQIECVIFYSLSKLGALTSQELKCEWNVVQYTPEKSTIMETFQY